MLKVKIRPEISDISWAITSLLHNGHYKLAFKLDSLLGICSGKFFGEFALVCNVVGICFIIKQ